MRTCGCFDRSSCCWSWLVVVVSRWVVPPASTALVSTAPASTAPTSRSTAHRAPLSTAFSPCSASRTPTSAHKPTMPPTRPSTHPAPSTAAPQAHASTVAAATLKARKTLNSEYRVSVSIH
ncbi:hypothetical protein M3J09_007961 [Ascochyta lentis]